MFGIGRRVVWCVVVGITATTGIASSVGAQSQSPTTVSVPPTSIPEVLVEINPVQRSARVAAPAAARAAGCLQNSRYEAEVCADSPISWWRFNGETTNTVADVVGMSPATLQVGVSRVQYGGLEQSGYAEFDGVVRPNGSAVYVGPALNNAAVESLSPPLVSVEAWVRQPTSVTSEGVVVRRRWNGYELTVLADGRVRASGYHVGGAATTLISTKSIRDDEWHHIVFTASGTEDVLYIDGVSDKRQSAVGNVSYFQFAGANTPGNPNAWGGGFAIGRDADWQGRAFRGDIDEVAVFGTVLSPERVLAHYNSPKSVFGPCASSPQQSSLGIKFVSVCGQHTVQDGFVFDMNLVLSRKGGVGSVVAAPPKEYELYYAGTFAFYRNGQINGRLPRGRFRMEVIGTTMPGLIRKGTCETCVMDGQYVFAEVVGTLPPQTEGGTVTVRGWADLNDNGVFDAGEPNDVRSTRLRRPAAFGDSYSSGEGAERYDAYTEKVGVNTCHRSKNAYARLTNIKEPSLQYSTSDVSLYSCSGARTYHLLSTLTTADSLNTGESNDLAGVNTNPAWDRVFPLTPTFPGGPNPGTPGSSEKRQYITAADQPITPDYVTVGIGGNDMEFANYLVTYCRAGIKGGGPCSATSAWTPPPGETTGVYNGVRTFGQFVDRRQEITLARIGRSIDQVKSIYPGVPVFLIGYPMLFSASFNVNSLECAGIVASFWESVGYFRSRQVQFDSQESTLASTKGVHYVGLLDAYDRGNHGICGGGGAAINGLAIPGANSFVGQLCQNVLKTGVIAVPAAPPVGLFTGVLGSICLYLVVAWYNGGLDSLTSSPAGVLSLATQGSFHPNTFGQNLDKTAIETYVKNWTGLRTPSGIPRIATPAAARLSTTPVVAAAIGTPQPAPAAAAPGVIPGQVSYFPEFSSCPNHPADQIRVVATGDIGGVVIPVRLQDSITDEVVATGSLTPLPGGGQAEGTLTLPPQTQRWRLLRVAGNYDLEISRDSFFVYRDAVPCAQPDTEIATAGIATSLNVSANDTGLSPTAFIGEVTQPSLGTVVVNGLALTYTPGVLSSGTDKFTYQLCDGQECTTSSVVVNVARPACTVTSIPLQRIVTGTEGNDVICVNDAVTEVLGLGGDDLIIVDSVGAFVNPGDGNNIVIFENDGIFGVSTTAGTVAIQAEVPYIRYSNGVIPTLNTPDVTPTPIPTPDGTPPKIIVTFPPSITIATSATAAVICSDETSSATCVSSVLLDTSSAGVKIVSVTARDLAGNVATVRLSYLVNSPDTVAPVVYGTTDRPAINSWYSAPVTVTWQSNDPLPSTDQPSIPPPITVTANGKDQVINSLPSCDSSSNCATASVTVSIDTVPPAIVITSPSANSPLLVGTTVNASYVCDDALSGVETNSCSGPVANGAQIDTATIGTKTFNVTAQDRAGNSFTTTITYTVVASTGPVVKADFNSGLTDVGFPTPAVAIWGTVTPNGPGPVTASVRWTATGPWTPFVLNNSTAFLAANVYPTNGTYQATVRMCSAQGQCGTDTITIRVGVPYPNPVGRCVIDRGTTANPRFLARFGYTNTAAVPVIAPTPLANFILPVPIGRGQPQILAPGTNSNAFEATFATSSGIAWTVYGKTATLKPGSVRC